MAGGYNIDKKLEQKDTLEMNNNEKVKILVVFSSIGGNTELVVQKVTQIIKESEKTSVDVVRVDSFDTTKPELLDQYNCLVLASPTYGQGTIESHFSPFLKAIKSKIKDKNFPNIIYEFVPQRCGFVEVKNNLIEAQLEGAFGGKVETKDYPYYCVITLNLKQNIQKYSNRGYNFSMIEVGHNCQNFLLKAVDLGLGALEYANFNTNLLTSILGLNENKSPIISIVFGAKDKLNNKKVLNQNNLANNLSFLKLKTVGEDKITPWVETTLSKTQEYYSGYYTSICDITIKQGNKKYIDGAFGYSTNRLESTIKCLAEAYERYSSTEYKLQNYSKAVDLDAQYLNPNLIYPLHNEFYNNNPIYQKFDPDSQRYFVKGKFLTSNKTVYVPIELIYFPVSNKVLGYKKHIFGNSTGTACHFDEQLALQSCILECIERDAFATSWYSGSGISQILDDDLPNWLIQKKIEWQKLGYKVYILNITKDSLPVVLSIIYSKDQFPALGTGCACRLTFEESIESAFLECEQGFMNWINSKHKIPNDIEPQNISRAWHHPALYSQGQNIEYLKPFLESKFESIANIYNLQTLESVISKFNFARFDLKIPSNKEDLWVIKVISPTLMPLNFGFGNEPFLHSRLNELNLAWSKPYPAFPHFFP